MSVPASAVNTAPSGSASSADAQTSNNVTATSASTSSSQIPNTSATATAPERKTLVVMDVAADATETSIKAIFTGEKLPEDSVVSVVKELGNTWFVTFNTGERATEAFKHATANSVSVRFKTVSSAAANPPTHTSGNQYYQYQGHHQSEFGEGHAHDGNSQYYRGPRRAPGYAGQNFTHTAPATRDAQPAANAHAPRTANPDNRRNKGRQQGQPQQHQPQTSHGAQPAAAQHSSQQSAASNTATQPTTTSSASSTSSTTQGRDGAQTRPSRSGSDRRSPSSPNGTSTGNTQQQQPGARRDKPNTARTGRADRAQNADKPQQGPTSPNAASPKAGQTGPTAMAAAEKTLTNFPPLGPPSGSKTATTHGGRNGYNGQTFTQYSRDTILGVIAGIDVTAIQRPNFDNGDSPVLLTAPQVELEINKPLPVGAKFEPIAQDKRSRSLSKNREPSAPAPTAAQIVAAAAAKQQTSNVKVTAAPTKAPAAANGPAAPAPATKHEERAKHESKASHSPKNASHEATSAPASASATTPAATVAPAASAPAKPTGMSWADRARASPAPVAEKKPASKPAAAVPAGEKAPSPVVEAIAPAATVEVSSTEVSN